MLFSRDMDDGVIRAYRIERRVSERQCDEVCTDPKPRGHVASGEAELYFRKVDPDDLGTSRKLPGDGDTGAATCVKDPYPRWEADDEIIQQRTIWRILTT